MEIINHPTPSFSPGSSSPSTSTIPAASTETIILRSYNYNHNHDNDHGKDGYSPPAKKKVPAIKRVSNWMKKQRISVPGLRLHAGRHHHYHQQQQQHHHPGQEQQQDSPPSFRNRDRGRDRDRDRDSDWHDDETITTSYAAFCTDFTTSNPTTTSHYNNPGKESRISGPETDGRTLASSAQDPDANSNTNNGANLSTPLPLSPQDVITPSLYISSEKAKHERIPQTESGAGSKGKQKRWCSVSSRRWFSFCRR